MKSKEEILKSYPWLNPESDESILTAGEYEQVLAAMEEYHQQGQRQGMASDELEKFKTIINRFSVFMTKEERELVLEIAAKSEELSSSQARVGELEKQYKAQSDRHHIELANAHATNSREEAIGFYKFLVKNKISVISQDLLEFPRNEHISAIMKIEDAYDKEYLQSQSL